MTLKSGDDWEAYHALMDKWAEAGGTSNMRVAAPFRKKAEQMAKRLEEADRNAPAECWSECADPYCPYTH